MIPNRISSPLSGQGPQSNPDIESLHIVVLQNYLNGSLILGAIVFFINLYFSVQEKNLISSITIFILFGILFLITFLRNLPSTFRIGMLVFVYFATGIFSLLKSGLNANGILYFFVGIVILGVLVKGLWWIGGLLFSGVFVSLIGVLVQFGLLRQGLFVPENNSLLYWISILTIFLFLIFVMVAPLNQYLVGLRNKVSTLSETEKNLSEDNKTLNAHVYSLESDIDRRRSRMIAARQIAREITQQTVIGTLLSNAVDLVKSQFGYYHAGIFLVDDRNEYAVLKAATGTAGKTLLSRNHRLRIREEGIVGFVVARGEPRIALDVGEDIVHFKNPDLPDTRSEMAVPLRVGRKIIGALDIQSDLEQAFSAEDTEVLQTIADQLATAIDKTVQLDEKTQRITELEQGYVSFTRGVWKSHLKGSKRNLRFGYLDEKVVTGVPSNKNEEEAVRTGLSVLTHEPTDSEKPAESIYSVPIKLRDQVLGVINIRYADNTIPPRFTALVETATNRLAVALENARLLEEIQERAEREHTVGEISSKVRSSQNIETILKTAISELGKTLGVDEVSIQLKTAKVE
jgi:GAF domain-containing protein